MNELFPPNITELLREKFERANQGSHGLKEWHQYFEKLASRVAHITDTEKRRRFWYGSAHYLQEKWSELGMGPEVSETTVDGLLKAGLVFEWSRGWRQAETQRVKSR
ncbi:hypothetical protein CPB86DRAFT_719439, partial [Serendipita vermifera]